MSAIKLNLDEKEKVANIATSLVTILAILAGSLVALIEYRSYQKEIRIQKSLELVKQYNEGYLLDSTIKIEEVWEELNSRLEGLSNVADPRSPEEITAAYEALIIQLVETNKILSNVKGVIGFYDRVIICVKTNLCEKSTVDQYFYNDAVNFFRAFTPIMCDQRRKWLDDDIWSDVQIYYIPETIGNTC